MANVKPTQARIELSKQNFQAADRFLDIFEYEITTIQVKEEGNAKKTYGECLNTKKDPGGSVACAFQGKLSDHEDLIRDITKLQNNGYSLWYMPNEGDGQSHPG